MKLLNTTFSKTLNDPNSDIGLMLGNFKKLSDDLAKADLSGTVASSKSAIENLNETMNSADQMLKNLDNLIADLDAGKGSLGALLKDEALYNNLKNTSKNLDLLLQDFRLQPERYKTILSGKERPYVKPADDPANQ